MKYLLNGLPSHPYIYPTGKHDAVRKYSEKTAEALRFRLLMEYN